MRQSRLVLSALFLVLGLFATEAFAVTGGISILGVEWGVGKFHRADDQIRNYSSTNSWSVAVLPGHARSTHPLVLETSTNMYTIYFYTLEELLIESAKLAQKTNSKILLFSVHGHGLPGAMWFPKDASTLQSSGCADWRSSAEGSDGGNYDQYYSAISKAEIMEFRRMSQQTPRFACTTGLAEWKLVVNRLGGIQKYFSPDTIVNFLSCIVGLGRAGDEFTKGIANLILPPGGKGAVRTSLNFGLGDWSVEKGMGFWDYQNDEQIERDGEIYVRNKRDADIAQLGQIRVASYQASEVKTVIMADQPYMAFTLQTSSLKALRGFKGRVFPVKPELEPSSGSMAPLPMRVRVPGTKHYVVRAK